MSAWIPSKPHIDAMLAEAVIRGVIEQRHLERAGWELTHEVVASVACRYDDETLDTLPGARPAWWLEYTGDERPVPEKPLVPYVHEPVGRRLSEAELVKAVGCFQYQACEHPEWEGSAAYRLCDDLLGAAGEAAKLPSDAAPGRGGVMTLDRIRVSAEYDRAPWGFEAEDLA